MYARTAFVFKPIVISANAPEAISSSLQAINEFIEFINHFRYRNTPTFDKDIELREQVVKWLEDADQQEALKKQVFTYWYDNHMPVEKIREKEQALKIVFDQFKGYSRFAYLTATELAVITIAIHKLILFLQVTRKQIKDVIIQEEIRHKLNELVECQDAIHQCMQKHLETFKKNEQQSEAHQDLPINDILLDLLKDIEALTGGEYTKAWPLTPDQSILFAIPDLPFGELDEAKTAKHYFEAFHIAQIAGQKWTKKAETAIDKAGEWTDWCLQGAWSLTSTVMTAPIKAVGGGVKMTSQALGLWKQNQDVSGAPLKQEEIKIEESKEPWLLLETQEVEQSEKLDLLTNDLHHYVEKMTQLVNKELESLEKSEALTKLHSKITAAIQILENELEKCVSSCFSFFMMSAITTKEAKANALRDLLRTKDLDELQQRAKGHMEGDQSRVILAGRTSRTKKILQEICSYRFESEDRSQPRIVDVCTI